MLRSRSLKLIAGTAVAALALAACGSSTSSSTSSSATSAATSAASAATSAASSAMSSGSSAASSAGSAASSAVSSAASGGATFPDMTGDPGSVKLGMAYDGPKGDQSFTDSAARGVVAATGKGVTLIAELAATVGEPDQKKVDRLSQLVDQGANTVIAVGFDYAGPMGTVAKANPDVHFAIVDDDSLKAVPNVASLTFAAEQSSYLVGLAAALKSKAKHVGFIGGVNTPLLQTFQAGFDAGAKAGDAGIKIDDKYITEPPDFSGFNDAAKGQTIAKGMYGGGADIIYAAAGGSGSGVITAAVADNTKMIGVDSDQYLLESKPERKAVIMTSAVKNVDVAVYDMIASVAAGKPLTGVQQYDLKNGGVGYSTSGGFVTDIAPQLEAAKAKIISGEIKVPATLG